MGTYSYELVFDNLNFQVRRDEDKVFAACVWHSLNVGVVDR